VTFIVLFAAKYGVQSLMSNLSVDSHWESVMLHPEWPEVHDRGGTSTF